ncbi:hypothetical protein AVEN_180818-1 [Araneus ventricosus]|uniref:Uncharacterized protein n=1 Tax=Araneus ventricosus TaxID=182803 RepID=A0A4Y2W6H2_ARAVE|nr:hypothetical protein AVEN_180818-1 [Araneus ventricosus]
MGANYNNCYKDRQITTVKKRLANILECTKHIAHFSNRQKSSYDLLSIFTRNLMQEQGQVSLSVSRVVFFLKIKTHSDFTIVNSDYAISLNYSQQVSMATTFNNMFYKSAKTLNELVMRLGSQTYDEINIIIANAEKPKKLPQSNPFLIQDFVKKSELAAEIEDKNDCIVVEMRRFLKQNSPKEISPVLITILGTTVPEAIKIWFVHQRLQKFIDRPRQCNKCFSFMHPSRICDKTIICYLCGAAHIGPCQQPVKCINCNGPHNAKSTSCPSYITEQKILELKCRNHITTGEARRIFQQNKATYSETVKTMPAVTNIEDTINAKFETLLQAINDRFERQMAIFADMLQKSMDCICQNFCKIITQCVDPGSSPVRKKKLFSNLRQMSNSINSWDAGGSQEAEDMPQC